MNDKRLIQKRGVQKIFYSQSTPNSETNISIEQKTPFSVAIWLYICAGLVFVMVVVGGVTRLTGYYCYLKKK
jgi:hypothetical protein